MLPFICFCFQKSDTSKSFDLCGCCRTCGEWCLYSEVTCLTDGECCLHGEVTCLTSGERCLHGEVTCLISGESCLHGEIICLTDGEHCLHGEVSCLTMVSAVSMSLKAWLSPEPTVLKLVTISLARAAKFKITCHVCGRDQNNHFKLSRKRKMPCWFYI